MKILTRMLIALAIAGLAATAAVAAHETPRRAVATTCGDRGAVAEQLMRRFKEVPVSIGLQSNGHVLEVFAAEKTGTWTLVVTTPEGHSCLFATGEHWQTIPPKSLDPVS